MSEAVKVIVRCRPMNTREKDLNCKMSVTMVGSRGQCSLQNPSDAKAPPKTFFFDGAYFLDSTTEQIYNDIAYPLVEGVTEGYNGTIFAYGQTGCGKSFTMQGINDPVTQRGVIPRAFDHIFETISVSKKCKYLVHASYLEIYNEEIRDLLGKDVKDKLDLKEHPEKGVYVAGISLHKVTNVKECQVIMDRGWKHRSTGATLMNADSSRSHSIFTINLECSERDEEGEDHIRAGKLNLVDLAGSERQSKTGSTGDRLKEATKINLSLSALGNVISALVDGKSKHIPYRDSKLTRLLQDSLGGNTKTLMVACLSPADNNYDETLSTLRYANRAKNIQNKPKINEDPKDALLRECQEEIMRLKQMLMGQIPIQIFPDQAGRAREGAETRSTIEVEEEKKAIEMEKETIKREYEERLREKEDQYTQEAADKAKLQHQMDKLRAYYDSKIANLDERYTNLSTTDKVSPSQVSRDPSSVGDHDPSVTPHVPGVSPRSALADDVLIVNRDGALTPDEHYTAAGETQLAVHVKSQPGVTQKSSSQPVKFPPAVSENSIKMSKEEALIRLKLLESGMVGGELANNTEMMERRTKRKKHAEERKQRLAQANLDLEDEGIMVGIYEGIQDELKLKNKLLTKEKQKVESLEQEIVDLQSEFEYDRIDYLDTIRKQERQVMLLQAILERVQPCIRRDCNYSSIDRVRAQAKWDEEANEWKIPNLSLERTQLPGYLPGQGAEGGGPPVYGGQMQPGGAVDDDRDRHYYSKLASKPDQSREYFQSRRASELLMRNKTMIAAPSPVQPMAMVSPPNYPTHNYPPMNGTGDRAAAVHGQMMASPGDEELQRRPTRLEALPLPQSGASGGKKGRRKRYE